MKIKFREVKLSKANQARLEQVNRIIAEYQKQGYTLTLRQLYYQLVSRDVVPNKQSEYAKLSTLLKEGRMAGIVDWDAIEDRLRKPSSPPSFDSPADILEACINQYALPRMNGQHNYVEVWVEKDALSGVLKRVTQKYHIPILVNRGYSSVSAMYDSYNRFKTAAQRKQKITILYLGDYDPSGVDMIRDIRERITDFFLGSAELHRKFQDLPSDEMRDFVRPHYNYDQDAIEDHEIAVEKGARDWAIKWVEQNFTVTPIALTREQITKYKPPPNPAKRTDPRAEKFIKKHGATSWEVDALKPEILNQILTTNIESLIDKTMYNKILKAEIIDKAKLEKLKTQL